MSVVAMKSLESRSFIIVCDERCAVVRQLAALIKAWDRQHKFAFVERDGADQEQHRLVSALDASRWSLLLVDDAKELWFGPESIPIILKNLPGGKIAAVAYILPGTMWLTRQLYLLVSRNKRMLIQSSV
jgi:predicted DCC family thiol-disulfide oxidoreductase YuxK